jgi:hypothetical protein
MGSSDNHALPAPGDLRLREYVREYVIHAAKACLCVACWTVIVAVLLIYGPPAMSLPTISGGLRMVEVVDAAFGILLSAGTGTFLTIVFAVGALTSIDRQHNQNADRQQHDETESTEDETHV